MLIFAPEIHGKNGIATNHSWDRIQFPICNAIILAQFVELCCCHCNRHEMKFYFQPIWKDSRLREMIQRKTFRLISLIGVFGGFLLFVRLECRAFGSWGVRVHRTRVASDVSNDSLINWTEHTYWIQNESFACRLIWMFRFVCNHFHLLNWRIKNENKFIKFHFCCSLCVCRYFSAESREPFRNTLVRARVCVCVYEQFELVGRSVGWFVSSVQF